MTDTYGAASGGGAPSAPAAPSAPTGLEINPDPVALPNPVGSQAPDRPTGDVPGSTHRPQSRREAIQEAFRKANASERPGPAKPRMGHNQPPEPMEKTPPKKGEEKSIPLDLRKRPGRDVSADTPPAIERARGEHGHFASRDGAQAPGSPSGSPQVRGQAPGQPNPAYAQAPPRMHAAAQRDWATTPETVRAEVHRMHREFGNAYTQMRADRDEMNAMRPIQQEAQKHGVSLAWAVNNYKTMEDRLRSHPLNGLEQIVWNMNLHTAQGQRITFHDICRHVAMLTPEQYRSVQQQSQQFSLAAQMEQVQRHQAWLAEQNRRMQQQRRYGQMRRQVEQFAAANPRLDELAPAIEREIKFGFDLPTAYARADRLYPRGNGHQARPPAAQTRTPPAQTRQPNRSISGAPAGGNPRVRLNGAQRSPSAPAPTRREALANAFRQVGGGL